MVASPFSSFSMIAAAAEAPHRIGLIDGDREWPCAELAELVAARAEGISGGGELVPVIADLSLRSAIEIYALLELGFPALLLHPRLTPGEMRGAIDTVERARLGRPGLLAIAFTSGTSGRPRSVLLSRRAFAASATATAELLGWKAEDRWLACLPFAHVGGLSILTRCLLGRRPLVLLPRFEPIALVEAIARHRATLLSLVPPMLDRILEELPGWRPPPWLRAVLVGGAAITPALLARARARRIPVVTTYGMTETCSHVALDGVPLPGVEVRVERDRILVRGPVVMDGYGPPDDRPLPFDEDGWFTTGDRGRFSGGVLEVWGRSDDVIITGGENVDPLEVERALEGVEGIRAACVFSVEDARWGQVVAAAVVGPRADLARVAATLGQHLAPHKRPRRIAILDALPLSSGGKIDRAAARAAARPKLVPLAYSVPLG
jgi:O-succinylbenzoic acid--CoA ligase